MHELYNDATLTCLARSCLHTMLFMQTCSMRARHTPHTSSSPLIDTASLCSAREWDGVRARARAREREVYCAALLVQRTFERGWRR